MSGNIPATVLIAARNEEANIERCLSSLSGFSEVIVVDSHSRDNTADLAAKHGATVVPFHWNGRYPKKRQWSLENITTKHDWILFIDADEVATPQFCKAVKDKLSNYTTTTAGFFVKGRYICDDKLLRFGMHNNKIALIHKDRMIFPEIDDLDLPGMGEIEGHYQPVLKPQHKDKKIGTINEPVLHYAYDNNWQARHKNYAVWERNMNKRNAWPQDPVFWRQMLKTLLRKMPGRAYIAFLHCYILKLGFLDGRPGYHFARDRYRYYRMIAKG